MSSCCEIQKPDDGHGHRHPRVDWIFWTTLPLVVIAYLAGTFFMDGVPAGAVQTFVHAVHEFVNTMWWGVIIGIIFLAILSRMPREFVLSILGDKKGLTGIARATLAGVLLDLCSHGILMVGSKLYERGASAGQIMAFLIASPWNSFSMTVILISLIGVGWTVGFIVLSLVIAIITGLIFDALVARAVLPVNPNRRDIPDDFKFFPEAKKQLSAVHWSPALFADMAMNGVRESKMVIRWLLFGIVLASVLRVFIDADGFEEYFGPTVMGLGATVFFATVLEVCSEGSSPIAADILNRGGAPGNAFAFLMTGVSTDYTEVMVLKDTTKSWKIALFLPLVTLPQILLIAYLINAFSS
jgi:uncharacterized membrane protein YraQ (UPF0718 family)